jgi:hypothetical protein
MTKEEIYQKAFEINKLKYEQLKYEKECRIAGICPECGGNLLDNKYNGKYSYTICVNNHESSIDYSHNNNDFDEY